MTNAEQSFGHLARLAELAKSRLAPRELLAFRAGLRAAHAEEALIQGDRLRAVAHFRGLALIAKAMNTKGEAAEAPSQAGFSFFEKSPWRYFRLVSETSGRTIYSKGPIRMSDNDAQQEEAAMLEVTLNRRLLARPERYTWDGATWRRS